MRSVVITGMGIVAPQGDTTEDLWDDVMAGIVLIEDDPVMSELGLKCHGVARCHGFNLRDLPEGTRHGAEGLGRFAQMGLAAGTRAMANAGLPSPALAPERCGVIFASAVGGAPEMQVLYEELTAQGTLPLRADDVKGNAYDGIFLDSVPSLLAAEGDFAGPTTTLTTGCTAGLDAVGLAIDLVRSGEADAVVAGAAESPLNGLSYATLDVIGCLSRTEGPVERASRPFDADRAGFVISEGAAFIVVEDAESAARRGATIYAELVGWATSSNAHHMTDLLADGGSMSRTLGACLKDAQVDPVAIDYINAHGSSTPQNDLFETNAIKCVFGEQARSIPISSLKSLIGHSLSSASIMALVVTVGAIQRQRIPPTANYETPDPACDLDYVTEGSRSHRVDHAVVMASGFGGIHTAAVLRRWGQ